MQAEGEQMQSTVGLICTWYVDSISFRHSVNHSLLAGFTACVLLRLWSLYVLVEVSETSPIAAVQVHIMVPACALGYFCLN